MMYLEGIYRNLEKVRILKRGVYAFVYGRIKARIYIRYCCILYSYIYIYIYIYIAWELPGCGIPQLGLVCNWFVLVYTPICMVGVYANARLIELEVIEMLIICYV